MLNDTVAQQFCFEKSMLEGMWNSNSRGVDFVEI